MIWLVGSMLEVENVLVELVAVLSNICGMSRNKQEQYFFLFKIIENSIN